MTLLATWNVNSLKVRLPLLQQWVAQVQPDIILLQELKCETAAFPYLEIEAMGYNALVCGQKTYNGVAILSKRPSKLRLDRLPGEVEDTQARYLEAECDNLIVASIYLPNGNPIEAEGQPSEKFAYKLRWLKRLEEHVRSLQATERAVVLGGDYNIIPQDEDTHDPEVWRGDALFRPESRAAWRHLTGLGLTDAFRALHPQVAQAYTFWDYQAAAWPRDHGIRIDHFLLSPEAADRLIECQIDRTPRSWDKASDHTPVLMRLKDT